jgi:hypothetical protein
LLFTVLTLVHVFVVKDEVQGVVSPLLEGLDWMICAEMNTVRIGEFLRRVSHHLDEFVAMILDGASSHKAADLEVPENIGLLTLPAAPQAQSAGARAG